MAYSPTWIRPKPMQHRMMLPCAKQAINERYSLNELEHSENA
jgi:hypothetical protein